MQSETAGLGPSPEGRGMKSETAGRRPSPGGRGAKEIVPTCTYALASLPLSPGGEGLNTALRD